MAWLIDDGDNDGDRDVADPTEIKKENTGHHPAEKNVSIVGEKRAQQTNQQMKE